MLLLWIVIICLFVILSICLVCFQHRDNTPLIDQSLQELAVKHNSTVIALIDSPCRDPLNNNGHDSINLETTTSLLEVLRTVKPTSTVDLIIHTEGGDIAASLQIALALSRHQGSINIYVPFYAYSAGTLLCLSARTIFMDPQAMLGPIDPQIGIASLDGAFAVSDLANMKNLKSIDHQDDSIVLGDLVGQKWIKLLKSKISEIMAPNYEPGTINMIFEELASGKLPHDAPLNWPRLQELGLNISPCRLPPSIYKAVSSVIYDTCRHRRTTVFVGRRGD